MPARDRSLVVDVAELRRRPGNRLEVRATVPATGIHLGDVAVPDGSPIDVALDLESLTDGLVATGTVHARWEGACRRCLDPAGGEVSVAVRELFRPAAGPDEEAFPIVDDQVDLRPMVNEVLTCDLPMAPVCRDDCAGLCPVCGARRDAGDCGHEDRPVDPRWAALDVLREQH